MPETKNIRLAVAAREFNVGTATIVEHLEANGYEIANRPTSRLTEEMYNVLVKEFHKDKGIKERADQINLGTKKREDVSLKPEAKPAAKKEDKKEVLVQSRLATGGEQTEAPKAPAPPTPPAKEEKPKPVETPAPAEPAPAATKSKEEEKPKVELDGPKVVGKVDLDKNKKKAEEKVVEKPKAKEEAPKPKKQEKPAAAAPKAKQPEKKQSAKSTKPEAEMIETKKVQLDGPKVMGKIELPKKPVKSSDGEKKKRRKRIIKSPSKPGQGQSGGGRPGGGGGRPGGGRTGGGRSGGRAGGGPGRRGRKPQVELSEKEIQEKIKNTLAKLSGASKGKSSRAKLRRAKRDDHAAREDEAMAAQDSSVLQVTEFISVAELASLMDVSSTEVISTCMGLGIIVSINQRLDAEVIELVSDEFGFKAEFINVSESEDIDEEEEVDDPADLEDRAPIVTIMGHVDHGKTSLLDYIREANVVAGEKGGITQHIGAYEVILESGKKIAFLDTPGHEAFTAMRARGAKVTDIAVIIVAADDSVMPQTKEAISHSQAAGVPMVFAINKVDKENANADRIKEQLSQMNILLEDWGGKFQSQEVSAKTGLNVPELLEKILLEAEMLELKANPNKNAIGTIIEASLDKGRGYVANVMVQEGSLKVGDMMLSGSHYGKVKAMFNERNQAIKEAGPSTPVLVLGLNGAPQAGERFKVYDNEQEVKSIATKRAQIQREQGIRTQKHITLDEIGRRLALGSFKELNLIVKGDVDGSVEALTDSLLKLSTEEIQINIVHKAVGQITESDVLLASASDAIIVGFQVRPSMTTRKLAEKEDIEIRMYSIIYDAIEEIKAAMEGMLEAKIEEKIVCNVEIREVFKISRVGTIAGCYVLDGKITRNTKVRVVREGIVVYTGELASLKRFKDDVKEVTSGMECGLNIDKFNDIKVGDIIEGYELIEVKRTL